MFFRVDYQALFGSIPMPDDICDVSREQWRRDRAVVNDIPTCLWHEQDQWYEDNTREDHQEPEDPMPASILSYDTAKDWCDHWSHDGSERSVSNVCSSFSRGDDVADDSVGKSDGSGRACSLQHSKD